MEGDSGKDFAATKDLVGLIILAVVVLIVLIGPFISPYPYDGMDVSVANQGPSAAHWFGTDQMGRDEFTRVLYGARISLMIGFVATAVNVLLGIIYGGIAGYAGGAVDIVMVRIMDIINSICSDHLHDPDHAASWFQCLQCYDRYLCKRLDRHGQSCPGTDHFSEREGICHSRFCPWGSKKKDFV